MQGQVFCDRIIAGGYKAGVYSKYMKHIEYLEQISPDYDLSELDLSEEEIAELGR